jgi:hypothetical protein
MSDKEENAAQKVTEAENKATPAPAAVPEEKSSPSTPASADDKPKDAAPEQAKPMPPSETKPSTDAPAPRVLPHEMTPLISSKPQTTPIMPPKPDEAAKPLDTGRDTLFVNSPSPAAKSAGQTCPKCGHLNRAGILVCEKCGTLLIGDEHVGGTKRFEGDKQQPAEAALKQATVTETNEMYSSAVTTAGSSQFTENMVLRLEIEGAPTPIMLHPKFETSLGRRDPATGTIPDVDLSAYAGYRLGVSRKHAVIRLKNRQLEIYDLGSSNGTSVNGTRLTPHQSQVLRDGDEIMLGKMLIRVLFQVRSRR